MVNILGRLLQEMKGKAQGTSATDSWEGADRIHRIFQQFGRVIFLI
jgi:hypothetical protein